MINNQQLYDILSDLAYQKFLSGAVSQRSVEYSPLVLNDFSACFGVDVIGGKSREGIYVKIPKEDLYRKGNNDILPVTEGDRRFAENEYRSLVYLSDFWRADDIGVRFIEPLGFLKEYNALITKRVYGDELFQVFRRIDLAGRLKPNGRIDPMHSFLSRLGTALNRFHLTSIDHRIFDMDTVLSKISSYSEKLQFFGINGEFIDSVSKSLEPLKGHSTITNFTKTLKGLDIRNILLNKEGDLFILDPGKMKDDVREADLARFLVTCRILYWGSLLFFVRFWPRPIYEEIFLEAYFGENEAHNEILIVLMIKELFKHWYMAHIALRLKKWGYPVKMFLKQMYINPFYQVQLTKEIAKLKR